jgi:hypothetical protein
VSPEPDDPRRPGRRPTPTRLLVWIVVGAIAVYLIVNGLIGILAKGG